MRCYSTDTTRLVAVAAALRTMSQEVMLVANFVEVSGVRG
jgi:hypothetical protein